jgi:hypothetical protein
MVPPRPKILRKPNPPIKGGNAKGMIMNVVKKLFPGKVKREVITV